MFSDGNYLGRFRKWGVFEDTEWLLEYAGDSGPIKYNLQEPFDLDQRKKDQKL